jgi:hypothetical protein
MKNQHYYYLTLLNLGTLCISTSGALGTFYSASAPLDYLVKSPGRLSCLGRLLLVEKRAYQKRVYKKQHYPSLEWYPTHPALGDLFFLHFNGVV